MSRWTPRGAPASLDDLSSTGERERESSSSRAPPAGKKGANLLKNERSSPEHDREKGAQVPSLDGKYVFTAPAPYFPSRV
eukprot:scaffold52686_cov28-Tisochrysis_lutea.AAC.5